MKQRFSSHTTLIELTLSLFFLMLAMVTILGLFTTAYSMSGDAGRLTRAMQLAQDCAALVEGGEHPAEALMENGYTQTGPGKLERIVGNLAVKVEIKLEQTLVGNLYEASIKVHNGEELLVEIPAAQYYNKEVIAP